MKNKLKIPIFVFFVFIFVFFVFGANTANAATLYFSPSSGNYSVGNILNTSVLINTQGQAINNSNATINFPSDLLEVISVSKSSSIFSLWVEGPAFSNSTGVVSFNAGLPTPGFSGTSGKTINIVFRVKKAGTATLIFSSAAVRANDGFGTNILGTKAQAQFNLIAEEPPIEEPAPPKPPAEEPPPVEIVGVPKAPKIFSSTHPDPNKWYAINDAKTTWTLPSDITGARLLLDRIPQAIPNVTYIPAINSKDMPDLEDGIWYFHVRLRNASGWGNSSHFRLQIDTKPPQPFEIIVKEGNETTYSQPTLVFETTDEISGIDYYEVKIDLEPSIKITETEYKMPSQSLGKHTVIVKAVDKAGNHTLAMTEINILSIEAPVITDYPHELPTGSILLIKGTALPEVVVKLYVQRDKKEIKITEIKSDIEGNWIYIEVDPVEKGVYKAWAEAIDSSGAKSLPSDEVTILVGPPAFLRIGKLAIDYLTTIMTFLILILVIIFAIFWFWILAKKKRRKADEDVDEAERASHQAFKMLRKEIEKQVAKLDGKQGLSAREKKIYNKLKEALKNSEKIISKKIRNIEKK